jgi:beta-glucanase (GH16 family)
VTTYRSFAFTYGLVEMRARIPAGRGLWPALWLRNKAPGWPPELDIMEVLGHEPATLYLTTHSKAGGVKSVVQRKISADDLSADYHVYGAKWGREKVTWYLDGEAIAEVPTPADMHAPMYLLANLAVGGRWPGAPDASTKFPASFQIDWIRVYQPSAGSNDDKDARHDEVPHAVDAFSPDSHLRGGGAGVSNRGKPGRISP